MMLRRQALLERHPGASEAEIRAALQAEPLPLRHAHAHRARGRPGERGAERRRQAVKNQPAGVHRERRRTGGELSLPARLFAQGLPGALQKTPMLDAWVRIASDGRISVFTGKAELGQGIKTALLQIAAEQARGAARADRARHRRTPRARRMRATPRAATR